MFAAALAIASLSQSASAQEHRLDLAGYGGWGYTADIAVESQTARDETGSVVVDSAPVYGALLGFRAQRNGYAYLSYSRMVSTAYFRPAGGFESTGQADVSFDYFQIGGSLEARRGRLVPYLGLSIGATSISLLDEPGNDLSFSAVLDGGLKILLTDVLYLRAIGRMPVSFVSGEAAALCVSGGCAFAYSGTPLLQGQVLLGAGLLL